MNNLFDKFTDHSQIHLTYSQRRLLEEYVFDLCVREKTTVEKILKLPALNRILYSKIDPVQKGKRLFELIRKKRFPISEGRDKNDSKRNSNSLSVKFLNTKERLINPYYYGNGIFNLKEHVVSLIRSCPLDCVYCFVKEIYDAPQFKIEPDYAKFQREIELLRKKESGILYLNAGENADSLIHDAEFDMISKIWKIIQPFPNLFLELRTKTDQIQNLLKIKNHDKRIVCAFSLCPEEDRKIYEKRAAPIAKRVKAMQILAREGWNLGLRFEPIIFSKQCLDNYSKLFDAFFKTISPKNIHSISLGCLRLTKGLAKKLRRTHPEILAEEWILAQDKKLRYCEEMRIRLYRNLLSHLKLLLPNLNNVFLSTEPVDVWKKLELPLKTLPEISKRQINGLQ